MDMRTCPKGHFYDGDINATCPVCEAEKKKGAGGITDGYLGTQGTGTTEAVSGSFVDIGATEPVGGGFSNIGATEPAGGGFSEIGATEAVNSFGGGETQAPTHPLGDSGETMRYYEKDAPGVDNYGGETIPASPGHVVGFTPVVGWLVCIDGPDRGHDYRIRAGYNHIGRAEHMDICIRGDMKISRDKHAIIAYDDEEKLFFFGPSDGRNIVRVNGKAMMGSTEIQAYDVLTVGSSKLLFIPLCGEKFDWSR